MVSGLYLRCQARSLPSVHDAPTSWRLFISLSQSRKSPFMLMPIELLTFPCIALSTSSSVIGRTLGAFLHALRRVLLRPQNLQILPSISCLPSLMQSPGTASTIASTTSSYIACGVFCESIVIQLWKQKQSRTILSPSSQDIFRSCRRSHLYSMGNANIQKDQTQRSKTCMVQPCFQVAS